MSTMNKCLIAQDEGKLQIPYGDYTTLMDQVQEARKLEHVKESVVSNLKAFLGGKHQIKEEASQEERIQPAKEAMDEQPELKVSVEFSEEPSTPEVKVEAITEPEAPVEEPAPVNKVTPKVEAKPKVARKVTNNMNVPPIKQDISDNFNKSDASGRLFSVFKQYYTCLNDSCGGTVRVTMKDGFCSLWNYDEWEEFAFIDLFEGQLRISVDPRYTSELQSLSLCEVPRLLSSRRSLVSAQVDGLSNTMLDVLVKAFEEVGLTAS